MEHLLKTDAFAALLFQVIGQQLSVTAARAILARLEALSGGRWLGDRGAAFPHRPAATGAMAALATWTGCCVDGGQMATHSPIRGRAAGLRGRRGERDVLDRLIDAVRAGESRALVLAGEPGAVSKTALLDYLAGRASGCRVVRTAGIQSEMELAFAGLQQVCAPLLDRLECLPGPQADALRTAFGLSAGPAPDRFLVGLAVLSL